MEPTRIPASLNEEDVFTLNMSMRQLVVVLLSFLFWFGASNIIGGILNINIIFTMIFFSWVLIGGVAMAFVKVDGKKLDEYLGEKINFEFGAKTYILKEEGESETTIEDITNRQLPDSFYDFNRDPVTVQRLPEKEEENV